jgi:hypothetical protein
VPDEERFVCLDRVVDEALGFDEDFSIQRAQALLDRKSTRLNSSHDV